MSSETVAPGIDHLALAVPDLDAPGMEPSEAPHRRNFARMYTSCLKQRGGVEIQLVNHDE